jgi:hypothetical protein
VRETPRDGSITARKPGNDVRFGAHHGFKSDNRAIFERAISKNCDGLKIAMGSWEGKKKAATHEER